MPTDAWIEVFPPPILSNSREVQEILFIPTHLDKTSAFLKSKFLQNVKITGGPNFLLQWPNVSKGRQKKFCKELATLANGSRGI